MELPPGNEEFGDPFQKNSVFLPLSADPLCVEVAPLRHFLGFAPLEWHWQLSDLQRGNVHRSQRGRARFQLGAGGRGREAGKVKQLLLWKANSSSGHAGPM